MSSCCLGSPVVPFYPFSFWAPLLKPNSRNKGTLIIKGLLGKLVVLLREFSQWLRFSSFLPLVSREWKNGSNSSYRV